VATLAAGTLHYMSPEVVDGKPIDTRADLWSLGVLLYRMLVGRLPFAGDDFVSVMRAILASDASPPSRTVPRLGPDMDAFFARALARDPDQRFQTIDELETAFSRASRASRRPPASAPAPASGPTSPGLPPEPEAPAAAAARGALELMPTLRSPVGPC
jgi:serine/threonine-protein kinase